MESDRPTCSRTLGAAIASVPAPKARPARPRRRPARLAATTLAFLLLALPLRASDNLALGAPSANLCIVDREGYALGYSEEHEQAAWVVYRLTAKELKKPVKRKDRFKPDPEIPTGSAALADYKGAPYDRGHLAPFRDQAWSRKVREESFFLSNMSPQVQGFNRGIWGALEDQAREWAERDTALWVSSGPVLEPGLPTIGKNRVSVPKAYFKVLLDLQGRTKAIGFLLRNEPSSQPLETFAVSIDSVEALTGLDFFGALPDSLESRLEAVPGALAAREWFRPDSLVEPLPAPDPAAVQCRGLTRGGERCRRLTKDASGLCPQHAGQSDAPATETDPDGR